MRRVVGITSILFLLVSVWIFFVELPQIFFLPAHAGLDFSIMIFIFPFGLLLLGLIGLYKAIRKNNKSNYTKILVVQIIYVVLILILGRLV